MADELGLTVLVAEDGAADRLLLAQIVMRQGHDVFTAENGQQAVDVFKAQRPQVVLLDALMPVMDGFEAARQIKALAGETLVPIIFLTALNEEQALVQQIIFSSTTINDDKMNRISVLPKNSPSSDRPKALFIENKK